MKFKEYDTIKIVVNPSDAEQDVVGYRGFVMQERGITEDGQQYLVALYPPDKIEDFHPVGGGVLPESCLEPCDDESLVEVLAQYTEWADTKLEDAKQKAKNVENGLAVLADQYGMTVEKLREIYSKVSDLIDTGSLEAEA
jgi:hypothetical protein